MITIFKSYYVPRDSHLGQDQPKNCQKGAIIEVKNQVIW